MRYRKLFAIIIFFLTSTLNAYAEASSKAFSEIKKNQKIICEESVKDGVTNNFLKLVDRLATDKKVLGKIKSNFLKDLKFLCKLALKNSKKDKKISPKIIPSVMMIDSFSRLSIALTEIKDDNNEILELIKELNTHMEASKLNTNEYFSYVLPYLIAPFEEGLKKHVLNDKATSKIPEHELNDLFNP